MSEYIVTIELTEKYKVRLEADTENGAIAKAFDYRYLWSYQCNADLYKVKVEAVANERV